MCKAIKAVQLMDGVDIALSLPKNTIHLFNRHYRSLEMLYFVKMSRVTF